MNADFRLSVGIFGHSKFVKLRKLGGDAAALALVQLMSYAAMHRPNGCLNDMDDEDIAIASGWSGDASAYVDMLAKLKWLDSDEDGSWSIHDWADHNPFVAAAPERSEKARAAANARWGKEKNSGADAPIASAGNAQSCDEHNQALPVASPSNAPLLSSPLLSDSSPTPPQREETTSHKNATSSGASPRTNAQFSPPNLVEVRAFFAEKGRPDLADEWHGYWDSVDWQRAKGVRMRKWQSAALGWIARKASEPPGGGGRASPGALSRQIAPVGQSAAALAAQAEEARLNAILEGGKR